MFAFVKIILQNIYIWTTAIYLLFASETCNSAAAEQEQDLCIMIGIKCYKCFDVLTFTMEKLLVLCCTMRKLQRFVTELPKTVRAGES